MAESAVNQVINTRMCKLQQMRWTPRGAHFLAQVRCAVLNGDAAEKLKSYSASKADDEIRDPKLSADLSAGGLNTPRFLTVPYVSERRIAAQSKPD
jgi:hypothetical protein